MSSRCQVTWMAASIGTANWVHRRGCHSWLYGSQQWLEIGNASHVFLYFLFPYVHQHSFQAHLQSFQIELCLKKVRQKEIKETFDEASGGVGCLTLETHVTHLCT